MKTALKIPKNGKLFWRERSRTECNKGQNHYELCRRRLKLLIKQKEKKKEKKDIKDTVKMSGLSKELGGRRPKQIPPPPPKKKKRKKEEDPKETVKCHVFVKHFFFPLFFFFFYGESPRTPPLEGTSLHRRNISMERPWGILSLFTTCLDYGWNHPIRVAVTCHLHTNW